MDLKQHPVEEKVVSRRSVSRVSRQAGEDEFLGRGAEGMGVSAPVPQCEEMSLFPLIRWE